MKQFLALFWLVILLLSGCQQLKQTETIPVSPIDRYLETHLIRPESGGKVFCAHEVLGTSPQKVYAGVYCGEFFLKNHKLQLGIGILTAVALTVEESGQEIKVISHEYSNSKVSKRQPRDIFPKELLPAVYQASSRVSPVVNESIRWRVSKYFEVEF